MISNITANSMSPSFGMARLTKVAQQSAEGLGVGRNEFINSDLFRKKGAIGEVLAEGGVNYGTICEQYGCNNNGKTSAEFIRTQVLSKKADKATSGVSDEEYSETMRKLFYANYDNPELKAPETLKLLEKARSAMAPQEYTVAAGLLHNAK